jgi:hypothetical protein
MGAPGKQLEAEIGITGEHVDYPLEDWRQAVAEEETISGYYEWCAMQIKSIQKDFFDDQIGLFEGTGKDIIYE